MFVFHSFGIEYSYHEFIHKCHCYGSAITFPQTKIRKVVTNVRYHVLSTQTDTISRLAYFQSRRN